MKHVLKDYYPQLAYSFWWSQGDQKGLETVISFSLSDSVLFSALPLYSEIILDFPCCRE